VAPDLAPSRRLLRRDRRPRPPQVTPASPDRTDGPGRVARPLGDGADEPLGNRMLPSEPRRGGARARTSRVPEAHHHGRHKDDLGWYSRAQP
jgi:hypothetical protein